MQHDSQFKMLDKMIAEARSNGSPLVVALERTRDDLSREQERSPCKCLYATGLTDSGEEVGQLWYLGGHREDNPRGPAQGTPSRKAEDV